jgi:hypothetical protein
MKASPHTAQSRTTQSVKLQSRVLATSAPDASLSAMVIAENDALFVASRTMLVPRLPLSGAAGYDGRA